MKTKRILCFALALLTLFSICISHVSALTVTVFGYKNIAVGATYTTTTPFTDRSYPNDYQLVDGKELTDGIYGSTAYGGEWVAFDHRMAKPAVITVDLGSKRADIYRLAIECRYTSTDGVGEPTSVVFFSSDDGTNFTILGTATKDSENLNKLYHYTSAKPFSGRYFRAQINHGSGVFAFVSEFEVCIQSEVEQEIPAEESEKLIFIGTSGLVRTEDDLLYGIKGNTTVNAFSKELTRGTKNLVVLGANGDEKKFDEILATGDVLKKFYNDLELDSVTVVVLGDVNSDGLVNSTDYLMLKRNVLGTYELSGTNLRAGCISGGETVGSADYLKLKRQVLGTYDMYGIFEKSAPVADDLMTFKMVSDVLYQMEYSYNGTPVKLTFDKKTWGTWNIGTFYYNGLALAGGGTDWEYVYRAASSKSQNWVWSGGNHGNETLIDISVYDNEESTEIDLAPGDSFKSKSISIVEQTRLHWGNPSDYYAEVTRTYYLAGTKLSLDVEYNFVKDCYMYKSYTCMFPVYKTYGRHTLAYHIDGTTHENYTTDGTVYPEYGNNYDQGYAAQKVTFWGDKQPGWKFDVEIFTPHDSTDDFSNSSKVMLWDMNKVSDKLYFSKYDDSVATKVSAGENVGTSSSWTFYVED